MTQLRQVVIAALVILVLIILLTRRIEGASAKKCSQTLAKFKDNKYGDDVEKPPLDAKACKNEYVRRGSKCFKSDGKEWKAQDASKCKKSWVGVVDWKYAHSKGLTADSPLQVSKKDWKKYINKDTSDQSQIDVTAVPKAQGCVDYCNQKSTECGGFVLSRTKDQQGNFQCYTRTNGQVTDPKGLVSKRGWNFYKRTSLGSTSSAPSTSTSSTPSTDVCKTDKVTFYKDIYGGESEALQCGKYTGGNLPLKRVADDARKGRGYPYASDLSSMTIPRGMKVYSVADVNGVKKEWTYWGNQSFKGNEWNDNIVEVQVQACNEDDFKKGCQRPS